MQVNTRATHAATVTQMTVLQTDIARLQTEISTNKRIALPSDDPVGSARATQLTRLLALHTVDKANIDRATTRLTAADTALGGVGTVLQRAKELALNGATGSLNASDRATIAGEVQQLGEQLLGLANTRDSDGASLFAGARTGGTAYAVDAYGATIWQGAGSAARIMLDSGSVATGLDGPAVFAGLDGGTAPPPVSTPIVTDVFAVLKGLQTALSEPDAAVRSAAMASALTGIDSGIGRSADSRATIGAKLARLGSETTRLDTVDLALHDDLSTTQDTDMTTAIAQLQRLTTVLQATQLSFVKIGSLSLWSELR